MVPPDDIRRTFLHFDLSFFELLFLFAVPLLSLQLLLIIEELGLERVNLLMKNGRTKARCIIFGEREIVGSLLVVELVRDNACIYIFKAMAIRPWYRVIPPPIDNGIEIDDPSCLITITALPKCPSRGFVIATMLEESVCGEFCDGFIVGKGIRV